MALDSTCATADCPKTFASAFVMPKANIVVNSSGSNGAYKSIQTALNASSALRKDRTRFVIHVQTGIYTEDVTVTPPMVNITIIGDGMNSTVVTGNKNTFLTGTFTVEADGFIARGMTFENTAGPEKGPAVAFRSSSPHSVCYQCSFKGYQDTLYVLSGKQFYRECDIYGTVDFIFGDVAAVLQNCNVFVRKPLEKQHEAYITAQKREIPNGNTGITIHNSKILATPELIPVLSSVKVYLGRPWGDYSRTAILKTCIDGLLDPAGWSNWKKEEHRMNTLYYVEYMNCGKGANTNGRVTWSTYHKDLSAKEVEPFTVENLLDGSSWLPATGVPFTPGL